MGYLLTQMFLYMLATFLLGLLMGWFLWRYSMAPAGDFSAVAEERDALRTNLDATRARAGKDRDALEAARAENADLQARLAAGGADADAVAKLRAENADLQSALSDCRAKTASLQAASAAAVAAPAAAVASSGPGKRPEALKQARNNQPDDLQQINGIGPKLEKLCHKLGFFHFDQIAAWSKDEVSWVDQNLEGFKGRVTRDQWIKQAKKLAK